MTTHTDPQVFANLDRPTVKEMVEAGLPKPQAQALFCHYHQTTLNSPGPPYDLTTLVLLLLRANRDMSS